MEPLESRLILLMELYTSRSLMAQVRIKSMLHENSELLNSEFPLKPPFRQHHLMWDQKGVMRVLLPDDCSDIKKM